MSFSIKYRPLCSIGIYHEFFLDDADDKFVDMDVTAREFRLANINYDFNDFFEVVPCQKTEKKLKGHQILIKQIGAQLHLLIHQDDSEDQPFISLGANTFFRFLIKVKDPLFFNYTNLKKPNNQIFLFTNKNIVSDIPLDPQDKNEVVDIQTDLTLIQLSSSTAAVDTSYLINPINTRKYYKLLAPKEQMGLFGILELHALSKTPDLSIMNDTGPLKLKEVDLVSRFHLLFENRKTIWKYRDAQNRDELFQTKKKKPFLKHSRFKLTSADLTDGSIKLPDFIPNPSPNLIVHNAGKDYSIMYINN